MAVRNPFVPPKMAKAAWTKMVADRDQISRVMALKRLEKIPEAIDANGYVDTVVADRLIKARTDPMKRAIAKTNGRKGGRPKKGSGRSKRSTKMSTDVEEYDPNITVDDEGCFSDEDLVTATAAVLPISGTIPSDLEGLEDENKFGFEKARRLREWNRLRAEKMDLDEREGKLVPLDQERSAWAVCARTLRDEIMSLPDSISEQLAAMEDPRAIRTFLKGILHGLLSTKLPDAVTRAMKKATKVA